jgi:sulfopropanediol 3-dehydrogenase
MPEYLKQSPLYNAESSEEVRRTVAEMLNAIERGGSDSVRGYSRRLDSWDPRSFIVDQDAIARAGDSLDDELKAHIAFAQEQVKSFAEAQRATLADLELETLPGVRLGHRHLAVENVGAYVPGGRYPMLASAFMTIIPAKVAGVARVVAAAPPFQGAGIHPAMLYAIASSGADEILCIGGVQALAAMAFGIEVAPVDMIVGAGNAYVAEAKRQLYGVVGIDLLAGPTEIVVIADASADPELVAADLLGQAEHGPTSPAVLIATDRKLALKVLEHVDSLLATWPTRDVAGQAWQAHGSVVVADGPEEAIGLSDEIAPEHLEVQVAEDELDDYLSRLRNYGSLFLGSEATVAFGDKAAGPNHVLPTRRAARFTGGLWVGKYLRTCTYQHLTVEGTRQIAPAVEAICRAERFAGHAITATMRLQRAAVQDTA